jgi:signal transduction histidine kinase
MGPPVRSRLRPFGLPPRIALGFAVAIGAVLAAALFSSLAFSATAKSSARVEEAAARQLAIEELESSLLVAHTALDAYLGTRDPAHRERHGSATSRIGPALERLASRSAGALAEGRDTVDRLRPEIATLRAEHEAALALADAGVFARALALRRDGVGREALERARMEIEELGLTGARLARERQDVWARSVRVANGVFLVAVAVLLVVVAQAARLVRDEVRGREENEAARERTLALQQRLMAVVSHDLRNPLTGILAAGWSLSRAHLPREEGKLARRIVVAGRRMERLIRDLLDWSRLHGGGGIPVSVRDADVASVCRSVTEEMADTQVPRIRIEREGDTCAVFDPDRLEQIVANLVSNALKYAPGDTPVHVRVVGEESEVRVEVRDEGPGLPPEVRAGLFEPFLRGRGAAKGDGSLGLGLFIVRTLAEAQGARVEVESAAGRGTTFAVRIPRRPSAEVAAAATLRTA